MAGKLTEEQREEICRRSALGESVCDLARRYGVTPGTISYHLEKRGYTRPSRRDAAAARRDALAESVSVQRLSELYWGPGYPSVSALARRLGMTDMSLRGRMKRGGIRLRSMAEQIAIEHREGRINWGGRRWTKGNAANLRKGRPKGATASRIAIEKMRKTRSTFFGRPDIVCKWCGVTVPRIRTEQQCCCKSHGAHWRWWQRWGNQPRPLIVDRLKSLLQSDDYKALPRTYQTLEKAGATIGATDAEYAEIMAEWARGG